MRAGKLVLLAAGGLVLAAVGVALVLASDEENKAAFLSLALTVGLSFLASGVIALWRRPENRTGAFMIAVSYLWFLGALTMSSDDWVYTIGVLVNSLSLGAFVHLLLAFPSGRLSGRRDAVLVATTYALVFVGSVAQLLVDEQPDPDCAECGSTIAVTNSDNARSIVSGVVGVLALALVVTILVIVVRRYVRSRGALRRALGPVLGTGALVMFVLLVQLVVGSVAEGAEEPLYYVFLVTFALVPVAFLIGVLRSRLARIGVADLLVELGRGTPLRDALARALRDPSLDVVYWLPDRACFVWHDGTEFHDDGGPRTVRYVERNGQRIGAVLHDPSLADERELVDAVAAAAGLWLDNDRLQAELRSQIAFLEAIVNASPSLLCSLRTDGRIANLNDAAWHASGYVLEEEIKGQLFWEAFVGPEERDESRRRFEAGAPTHDGATFEHTFVNQRGEPLTIAWSTGPLLNEQGGVRYIVCGGLDVTERKQYELELGRERDFLRRVADTTPSLLVVVDHEATVAGHSVNKSFEHTIGWGEQEMLGRSFIDLFRPEDRDDARDGIASAVDGIEPAGRISHWSTRDGRERIIEWTATPIVEMTGIEFVLVCGVDVTEREHRESDLRASEQRLQAAIEASPVAIVEYALDDTITRWNPAAERIFGWTAEQVVGGKARHQPPGREAELVELFRRVRDGEVYTGVESKRVRSDGVYIDVAIAAAPIRDAAGHVVSHMAMFADITARKRQEEELQASEERLRAAIEASPVAIVEFGLDDTIIRWNPAAEKIFGWTAEQVIGGKPKHRPPGRDAELADLSRRVVAGEVYASVETERLRKDGSLIDVEISTAPIFDDAGVVVSYMALYADITDRKRQDAEVRASRARIVEAGDGARRQLERNLHDGAQQRLVALSLSLRLAQSKVSTSPSEAEAVLEGARAELAAALDELRELARGIHPAVLTDRGLAAAVEALATRSPVPVGVDIAPVVLPPAVEAGAYYVIAESLANVAKYAQATGVMVRVCRENGRVLVEVADDGAGGADPTAGSGLRGLADRVEALGGRLTVDSPAGGGTCVSAAIPLQ